MKILLIEDSQDDARLIQEMLSELPSDQCDLTHVDRLSDGLDKLGQDGIDVVLLDLHLPDSHGLETLSQLRAQAPGVPVIVLTGADDETTALSAMHKGAQDYLVKGQVDSRFLVRSMHYAIERQRLLHALEESRQQAQRERELRMLELAVPTPQSPATAGVFGQKSLQEGSPQEFRELVGQYESLIDLALEQRTFKVQYDLTGQLRTLAERLGFRRAAPRDVVEIHSAALKKKTSESPSAKVQACSEEARFMLLELMGHLCSHYRTYSYSSRTIRTGSPAATVSSRQESPSQEIINE